ncbi:MAG: hypothetical protein IV100_19610 [Myxococcales bacterium]|nr:hypothetical protein [Myxococcales bacterium]
MARPLWTLFPVAAATIAGCDSGPGLSADAATSVTPDCTIEPTFSSLHQRYFQPSCTFAACHAVAGFSGLGLGRSVAHVNLVGVESVRAPGVLRVAPGDPDASFLVHKIEGTHGPEQGDLMPPGGDTPSADDCRVRRVREWIERGAPDD